ncbi:MAG: hypothetical protein ACXWWN_04715, partial [Gemmatimonadales bacterium]
MDRRTIWAILLMMVIAIAPAILFKKPAASGTAGQRDSTPATASDSSAVAPTPVRDSSVAAPVRDTGRATGADTLTRLPAVPPRAAGATDDTVRVTSPLYTYGISTRGGRLVEATLSRYRSMAPGQKGQPAQLLPPDSRLLGLTLVRGQDTIPLHDWS